MFRAVKWDDENAIVHDLLRMRDEAIVLDEGNFERCPSVCAYELQNGWTDFHEI
jgi:hypothetical protein